MTAPRCVLRPRRVVVVAVALLGLGACATALQGPPAADLADERTGRIAFATMTPTLGRGH